MFPIADLDEINKDISTLSPKSSKICSWCINQYLKYANTHLRKNM